MQLKDQAAIVTGGASGLGAATARKLAILFYKALRFGMAYVDPGASYYEARYRQRVLHSLHRRAQHLGFTLVATTPVASGGVS